MRHFLDWQAPLLPAVAEWLLRESGDGDLGAFVVVTRGRAAGRRLLALLAAEAQRAGKILIPPRLTTPGGLADALFESDTPHAGKIQRRLAWASALDQAGPEVLHALWRIPGNNPQATDTTSLADVLDRAWQDLAESGTGFREALKVMERISPELAEFETPRWHALAAIADEYHRTLKNWGLRDASAARRDLAESAQPLQSPRVVLAGVIELAPVLARLLGRLPVKPSVLIHAPESLRDGFDELGRLEPAFWAAHPARFDSGEIHVVRDAAAQAARCAGIIRAWQNAGLSPGAVTIAAPEPDSIPALLDGLDDHGVPVRAAQGRPASRSAVLELLAALADYLDHPPGEPPLFSAVARLLRHPDLAPLTGASIAKLDAFFEDHLPWRIGRLPCDAVPGIAKLRDLIAGIEGLADGRAARLADGVTALLLRVYGRRRLSRHSAEGRPLIHALEAVSAVLDELKSLPSRALKSRTPAGLLRLLVEIAGAAEIPEPENVEAAEITGWLEAAADDVPGLIVTSVFEGSLPEGAGADPMLPDLLRAHLGLPCRASRFARDQYTLHAVRESRRKSGAFALIVPRRDAAGVPARPSRLLIAAHEGRELAARLLHLTASPEPARVESAAGPGFDPPVPDAAPARAFRKFPVTSFRTHLASPRLFHLKHVLGLKDRGDDADEMDGGVFGTVMHTVLGEFGARRPGRLEAMSARAIREELDGLLDDCLRRRFGTDPLPPLPLQKFALRERLRVFAEHQARLFAEGWRIAYVEKREPLEVPFAVPGAPEDVSLKGKIDRVDFHPDHGWRVIDYKTGGTAEKPLAAHFAQRKGVWKDLQLPLYLELLPALGELEGGRVERGRTELVYFNLPADEAASGITDPFPAERCDEAIGEARRIVREVCSGARIGEPGDVRQDEDPAFLALCGLNGLPVIEREDE